MSARVCGTCGAELEQGAMFCAECGARVGAPSQQATGPVPPPPGAVSTAPPAYGPTSAPLPTVPPAARRAAPWPDAPQDPSTGGLRDAAPGGNDSAAPGLAGSPPGLAGPPPPGPSGPPAAAAGAGVRAAAGRPSGDFPLVPGSVAPVGRRVAAYAIDLVAVSVLAGVGLGIALIATGTPEPGQTPTVGAALVLPYVLAGLGGLALWLSESFTGATAGGALLGIRTVSRRTGRPAGLLAIFLRSLVVGVGSLACGLGNWLVAASGAFDKTPAQQGWHDKAAGTLVLRASATGVARTADPDAAWDDAVARAVGGGRAPGGEAGPAGPPVPPPPVATAPPTALAPPSAAPAPPSAAPTAPSTAPTTPAAAPSAPVAPAPGAAAPVPPPPGVPSPPATPSATEEPPRAAAGEDVGHVIGLVPLPPGVGAPRTPPGGAPEGLITGLPRSGADAPPAEPPAVPPAPDLVAPDDAPAGRPAPRRDLVEDFDELELTRMRTSDDLHPTPGVQGLRLVFDTGERVDVVGEGVVGRAPSPQPGIDHVVAIDDPARSVSKVHLAFGPTDGLQELWVVDRGSTNGTVVVRPDGTAATLPEGTRATVGPGWTIRFGERSVTVERR